MSASLPNALPAFMSIAQAALPTDFQVALGAVLLSPYAAPQTLLVLGANFTEDAFAELGPTYRHEEHYSIRCNLTSFAGDRDQLARLAETYALYKSILIAVAAAPTLNGTVRLAWCSQLGYTPMADSKGMTFGSLDFEVQCQARVDSLD